MGIFDLLLETDTKKLKASNSKDFEIKRLSEALGERFVVTCTPLTAEQIQYVGEVSKSNTEMKANIVLECCNLEGKSLKSKELLEKFSVPTQQGRCKRSKKALEDGDCLANLAYFCFIKHGILPSVIYNLPKGELSLIRAFYVIDSESRNG